MKIWYQHGSEHSANLVMIGYFKDSVEAARTNEIIKALTKQALEDHDNGPIVSGSTSERFGNAMLDLLKSLNVASIGPRELEQFLDDVNMTIEDSRIILKTDEFDISAFLKVMLDGGARIEVYSAHDYPDPAHGRRR